jgi:hypothetical protein
MIKLGILRNRRPGSFNRLGLQLTTSTRTRFFIETSNLKIFYMSMEARASEMDELRSLILGLLAALKGMKNTKIFMEVPITFPPRC